MIMISRHPTAKAQEPHTPGALPPAVLMTMRDSTFHTTDPNRARRVSAGGVALSSNHQHPAAGRRQLQAARARVINGHGGVGGSVRYATKSGLRCHYGRPAVAFRRTRRRCALANTSYAHAWPRDGREPAPDP